MKAPYAKAYLTTILSIIIFVVGCNNKNTIAKTTILLAPFSRATLDTSGTVTQLKIL
jgi:uncharacterized lipoprotein NlpE involved in copper resistance